MKFDQRVLCELFPSQSDVSRSPGISTPWYINRLSEIAAPNALVQSTTDLGVAVGGENLGVTSLTLVSPSLGLSGADTVKTRETRDLAEPATHEDVLEVISITRSKDLAVRTGVKLVDHLAVGGDNSVHGVGLKLSVVGKSLEAQLRTPSVDDTLVAGSSGRRSRGSRSDDSLSAGRGRCLGLVGSGAGRGRGVLFVDNSSYGRGLVYSRGGLVGRLVGGLSVGLLSLSEVDCVNDSLIDDVNVLDLLVFGLAPGRSSESRAGKGEDGSGSAHFDSVRFEVGNELTGIDLSV